MSPIVVRSALGFAASGAVWRGDRHSRTVVADTALDRVKSVTDELGRTVNYLYDTSGRPTQVTLPEGNYWTFGYDSRGNVTGTTAVAKSGSGLANIVTSASFDLSCTNSVKCNKPNSTTDAKGNVTNYTYDDAHGGVLTATRPAPATGLTRPQTRYSYASITSASGDPVYELTGVSACQTGHPETPSSCLNTADEARVTAAYNSNLLPTSTARSNGAGTLSATETYTYDPAGNRLTVDAPLTGSGDTTRFRYDAGRQLTGIMDPDPDAPNTGLNIRAVQLTYRPDGQVSKQELGTITGTSTPSWSTFTASQAVDITFDANARPVTSKLSGSGADKALTQTSYDALGRPDCTAVRMNTAIYGSLPSSACTLGTQGSFGPDRISQVVYDAASEPTQLKVAVGTADAATERTLSYTNNGLVQTLTDGENNKTTYVYDGFDRLSQTQYPSSTKGSGTSNTSDYEQLSYDANSNVTQIRSRNSETISLTYDNLDRVTSKSSSSLPSVDYAYDLLDRLNSASFASSGLGISNSYDALNRLSSTQNNLGGTALILSYLYDAAGQRTQMTYPDGHYLNYDRLNNGAVSAIRVNGATSGAGVVASYNYDSLGNRTAANYGGGSTNSYTYDAVGRLASLGITFTETTANDVTKTFSYNPASQVTATTNSNDAYAWTGATNTNTTYTSNGLNQLTAAGGTSVGYGLNGNLNAFGADSYSYDVENKMISATVGGVSTTLSYDPLGRLWRVQSGSTDTRYVDDGLNLAAVYSGSTYNADWIFGPGIDEPIAAVSSGATPDGWLHPDERGSIIARAGSNGANNAIQSYDEYGVGGTSNVTGFRFTGQLYLPSVGLHYYKARMYSVALGRFMQTDPVGPVDSPNLYQYALDDPVNLSDPLGLAGVQR